MGDDMAIRGALAMLFGTRRPVRVHMEKGPSIEGYLAAVRSGHYIIDMPAVMMDDHGPAEKLRDARAVEIPKANVLFLEVLR